MKSISVSTLFAGTIAILSGACNGTSTATSTEVRAGAPTGGGYALGGTAGGGAANSGGTHSTTGSSTRSVGGTSNGGMKGSGGTTSTSGGGTGKLLFVGDFETGDLSQWNYVERCATDRITVYSSANAPSGAPAPRQGNYAVRFHVLDSDVAPCTSTENPRAELETVESLFHPGDEAWEAWSVYVPSSHPPPSCGACSGGTWFDFQDDYGPPYDGSASIGWFFDFVSSPNSFSLDRGDQYGHDQPWIGALTTGIWVDFLVHKRFANVDDGSGFVEAWINGNPITFSTCNCTQLSTQTMHSTQSSLGFYLTAYRAAGLFNSFDVFYDAVRIGTTRTIVEPP